MNMVELYRRVMEANIRHGREYRKALKLMRENPENEAYKKVCYERRSKWRAFYRKWEYLLVIENGRKL